MEESRLGLDEAPAKAPDEVRDEVSGQICWNSTESRVATNDDGTFVTRYYTVPPRRDFHSKQTRDTH